MNATLLYTVSTVPCIQVSTPSAHVHIWSPPRESIFFLVSIQGNQMLREGNPRLDQESLWVIRLSSATYKQSFSSTSESSGVQFVIWSKERRHRINTRTLTLVHPQGNMNRLAVTTTSLLPIPHNPSWLESQKKPTDVEAWEKKIPQEWLSQMNAIKGNARTADHSIIWQNKCMTILVIPTLVHN